MSISDFERLIIEIKLEVQEGNINAVLENIITVANEARNANKSGFNMMKNFIISEKLR